MPTSREKETLRREHVTRTRAVEDAKNSLARALTPLAEVEADETSVETKVTPIRAKSAMDMAKASGIVIFENASERLLAHIDPAYLLVERWIATKTGWTKSPHDYLYRIPRVHLTALIHYATGYDLTTGKRTPVMMSGNLGAYLKNHPNLPVIMEIAEDEYAYVSVAKGVDTTEKPGHAILLRPRPAKTMVDKKRRTDP